MNHPSLKYLSLFAAGLLAAAIPVCGAITLPKVIGSNMVLQRGQPVPIWGWAAPGEDISVEFAGQKQSAKADAGGRWEVRLARLETASTPATMLITAGQAIVLTNILVGEVWLCSGQSNMEKPIGPQPGQRPVQNSQLELATGDRYPQIRVFKAEHVAAGSPEKDVPGAWTECSSNSLAALKLSAAAYFFAREIFDQLHVPIGLVQSTWGGTRIEPWTPPAGFEAVPATAALLKSSPGTKPATRTMPSALYNGMIAPLEPFALRGALWYQGESNCRDPKGDGLPNYADKFEALIKGWRKAWGQGDFAFYYVQLAPYNYFSNRAKPAADTPERLPEAWESQTHCLRLPHTGMAVITDTVDDLNDIHPINKQAVGQRLALLALNQTYGRTNVVCTGPMFRAMQVKGDQAILSFDGIGGGLVCQGGERLNSFTIAGADGKFVPAEARIKGDTVVVTSGEVAAPKAVRFGWNEQAQPNFFNQAGLPASPFRTDDPWSTEGAK